MKFGLHLLLPAALVMAVGCSVSSVNTVENADKSAAMTILRDTRVDTDPSFADDFGVVRINTAENAAGLLRVQLEMENFSRKRLAVSAQLDWYDGSAMRIDSAGGGWQQYVFEPRESRSILFTAPAREARDFRLKLIKPKN